MANNNVLHSIARGPVGVVSRRITDLIDRANRTRCSCSPAAVGALRDLQLSADRPARKRSRCSSMNRVTACEAGRVRGEKHVRRLAAFLRSAPSRDDGAPRSRATRAILLGLPGDARRPVALSVATGFRKSHHSTGHQRLDGGLSRARTGVGGLDDGLGLLQLLDFQLEVSHPGSTPVPQLCSFLGNARLPRREFPWLVPPGANRFLTRRRGGITSGSAGMQPAPAFDPART